VERAHRVSERKSGSRLASVGMTRLGLCVFDGGGDGVEKLQVLHCATPDFLWRLVALMECMRLSLRKGAQVALSRAAWQEIRVRFGRDDKVGVVRF
jgi:hypothetical protein